MTSITSIAKIRPLNEIVCEAEAARANGQPVIFANGCFDMLHVGHVRYLQRAKDLGGILIVAVNSDQSVRKIKGDGRPLMPEDERAEIVAALGCVDFVTIFSDSTVNNLLLAIRPDVQVKGTDYTVDTVPERETVKSYGGRVAIVGDPKDHSTTELIEKRNRICF
jgi:rfaE bifunctional protein nucleotidyltransferase chain/domain